MQNSHLRSRAAATRAVLLGAALLISGGVAGAQEAGATPQLSPNSTPPAVTVAQAAEPGAADAARDESEEPAPKPKLRLEINGFAQLDFIHDFNRVAPEWSATLRPSRIPVDNPLPDGETILSIRQSRLNFLGFVPSSMGEIKTRFEFDLFGVGDDAGQTTMRIRHVYGEFGAFLFGQTNSVFMDGDLVPSTLDYWGPAGVVFLRNPQVRWTPVNKEGRRVAVSLEAPGSAVDSGKVDEIDPTLGLRGRTKWPDLAAHYRQEARWGHVQLSGILRSLAFESATSPNGEPSGTETGYGLSFGTRAQIGKKDRVYAQFTWGEGISSYMNDGGSDLGPTADIRADTIQSLGAQLYLEHPWSDKWTSTVGYSVHQQDNLGGQTADAFKAGRYLSANLVYTPVPNVMMGVEYLWGERENNGGAKGSDNRIQFSAKYNFSN